MLNAHLSMVLEETKKGTSQNFDEKSTSVPRKGLEPLRLAAHAPQTCLYTIPTPGQCIINSKV